MCAEFVYTCPLLDMCPNPAVSNENLHWTALPLKISIRFYPKEEEISIGFCFGGKNKILFLILFFILKYCVKMMWKIVISAEVSVIYIYIYIYI